MARTVAQPRRAETLARRRLRVTRGEAAAAHHLIAGERLVLLLELVEWELHVARAHVHLGQHPEDVALAAHDGIAALVVAHPELEVAVEGAVLERHVGGR